jgi:hypothetical protein
MVDAENSTSLPGVTRRRLLAGAATIPLAPILDQRPASATMSPIAALYQDWRRADAEAARWCRKWGELETKLANSVGYPRVQIPLPPPAAATWVTTHGDIDRELAGYPALEAPSNGLHAELAARKARWDAEAEAIGLDEAERQEARAWKKRETLAFRVFALPAGDVAGVITKLTLILRMGQAREHDDEFPWPQIGSAVADLQRLAASPTAPAR